MVKRAKKSAGKRGPDSEVTTIRLPDPHRREFDEFCERQARTKRDVAGRVLSIFLGLEPAEQDFLLRHADERDRMIASLMMLAQAARDSSIDPKSDLGKAVDALRAAVQRTAFGL